MATSHPHMNLNHPQCPIPLPAIRFNHRQKLQSLVDFGTAGDHGVLTRMRILQGYKQPGHWLTAHPDFVAMFDDAPDDVAVEVELEDGRTFFVLFKDDKVTSFWSYPKQWLTLYDVTIPLCVDCALLTGDQIKTRWKRFNGRDGEYVYFDQQNTKITRTIPHELTTDGTVSNIISVLYQRLLTV